MESEPPSVADDIESFDEVCPLPPIGLAGTRRVSGHYAQECSNSNGHNEKRSPEDNQPKEDVSVIRAKANRRRSVNRILRRLSSSNISIGSLESVSARTSLNIQQIRSSIDVVESHLQRIEANGDLSFDFEDLQDDEVFGTLMKDVDFAEDEFAEDEIDDQSENFDDCLEKLRELRNSLQAVEWNSVQSFNSNSSDESKVKIKANHTDKVYKNTDDGDDLLAEKLDHMKAIDRTTESVTDILRKASILPCSLFDLKFFLIQERNNEERVGMDREKNTATEEENEVKLRASNSTTRKIAGRNSLFRSSREDTKTSPKRPSILSKKGFLSLLSKTESLDEDCGEDHMILQASGENHNGKGGNDSLLYNKDLYESMHRPNERYDYFPPLDEIVDDQLMNNELVQETFILYFIFRKFSTPCPSYNVVSSILEYERRRISNDVKFSHSHKRKSIHQIAFAQDVVINVGDASVDYFPISEDGPSRTSSFVAAILDPDIMFKLPLHFRLAYLRILIRLLTGENDDEYDDALSLEPMKSSVVSDAGNAEVGKNKGRPTISPMKHGQRVGSTKSFRNEDLKFLYDRNNRRNNLSFESLYSVVRFCCGEHPERYIDNVIRMIELLIGPQETEDRRSKSLLLHPLCRLLGLLCTAGISAKQLRKIMSLIRDDTFRMNVNMHVLRALVVATEGSSLAKKLKGKASPQSFFNFGRSNGISKTVYPPQSAKFINSWPFKTSFGMSCWFRVEDFGICSSHDVPARLFKISSGDGTNFEISFKLLASSSINAAHITFTVRDSDVSRKVAHTPLTRGIELVGCPIVPRVWFHIAVRHTKKNYLSLSKDEVTILLDGKPMLTEYLKFPKSSADSSHSKQQPAQPTEISFCSGLDAQAGSLFVFHDVVTDETFHSLYKFTSGKSETEAVPKEIERPGFMAALENKVNPLTASIHEEDSAIMNLKQADVEEMAIPRARTTSGGGTQFEGRPNNTAALDLIGDDEYCNDIHNPSSGEFSRQAFVSNIYFVWDPARVTADDNLLLEAHSSIHVNLDKINCVPWKMRSAKDVISSIGGIQSLLIVFRSLILPETAPSAGEIKTENKDFDSAVSIPFAISLLAAFLRDKDVNGREWIRCGGTEIVEYFLLQSKERYASSWSCNSHQRDLWVNLNAFRQHHHFAEELVSALLDLSEACSYNAYLHLKVSSQLVFNVDLWLGGLGKVPGTALHSVLLPALSSITKSDPEQASCAIRTSLMINLVREYTILPKETKKNGDCRSSGRKSFSKVMTVSERKHMLDTIMGILLMVLSVEVTLPNLLPLIRFISFHLDMEWEHVQKSKALEGGGVQSDEETRRLRLCASDKVCSLLALLLQSRPVIPGLFKTLNEIVGDTVSWILCCMVNCYDDKMRSNGIRCMTSLYDAILSDIPDERNGSSMTLGAKRAVSKVSRTIKNVGAGLGVLPKVFDTSSKSLSVAYKLLWHFLKCHCQDLDIHSHSALVNLIVDDASESHSHEIVSTFVIPDDTLLHGYRFYHERTDTIETLTHSPTLRLRNTYACSTILQLLRYLPNKEQERWLFDLLTLLRVNESTAEGIIQTRDWQHCLFHVASDTVEELSQFNISKWQEEHNIGHEQRSSDDDRNIHSRFDLTFQLYSMLLGRSLRDDNDSIAALELAASLQRVCVNGVAVFSILLSNILSNLITSGTLSSSIVNSSSFDEDASENRVLKECAKTFFSMEVAQAAKHWKKLRHITAIVVATVTSNGYNPVDLLDYRNNLSSVVDENSGGVFGIRLDHNSAGIVAADVMVGTRDLRNREGIAVEQNAQLKHYFRRICTTLSSQILELLDPYIFPDHVDHSIPGSHQQNSALIRSTEHRLGNTQGPLVSSLVRLSLVLLSHLEPSSVKFLKICSMLRCFLHWCLDIARESSIQPAVFKEETKSIDNLVVSVVLKCHRCLSKCSSVMTELGMSSGKYFTAADQIKHIRRVHKAVEILGDIVLDVYKGRNAVLLEAFSPEAYKALELSIATKDEWTHNTEDSTVPNMQETRRMGIRSFLDSDWIKMFHDNNYSESDMPIPEQLNTSEPESEEEIGDRASKVMDGLATESRLVCEEYNRALNSPFLKYLEEQKRWADTSAVRDLEYYGNLSIKNLAEQYFKHNKELVRTELLKADMASQRLASIERRIMVHVTNNKWKLAKYTDRLHRRILLVPNRNFNDHASASYDLALGIEREKALKEREERLRAKREDELAKMYQLAKQGIVKQSSEVNSQDEEFIDSESDSITSDSDDQSMSIEPLSDDDVAPGELITDWDRIEADDIMLDSKNEKGSYLWSKDYIWQHGERLIHYLEHVQLVTVQSILTGELVLTTHSLYFRPTEDPISVMTKETIKAAGNRNSPDRLEESRWRLNRLTEVHERRYMLRTQATELFFADTHELFINFCEGVKVRDKFIDKLRQCRTPLLSLPKNLNPKAVFKTRFSRLTQQWQKRKISNFEYLMQINIIAGRTFNDVSQYPVFPWVIADYSSEELDLNDPNSFRDLTKPVGALNPDRLLQLLERYHDLDGLPEEERFLYGSHYSSPGAVLHYLIRQEPFTTMAIELQSGRFDCPDRLFYDIAGSWQSCLQSTSDVKELVPELFTCPEILLNTNDFPLGETQTKKSISNVKLPKWANGSAHEFVRLNRLALESEYVSINLHHWIDLIFGFKQRGLESVKANNVFHFLSYEGSVDLDKITDELDRKATESQIQNFGQTPSQILTSAHPPRFSAKKCWKPIISELSPTRRLMCYTPFKQFGGNRSMNKHGPVVSIQLLTDHVVVVYADLSVGTYKWSPKRHGKTPFYLKMNNIRPIASREMSISKFAMGVQMTKPTKSSGSNGTNQNRENACQGIGNWSFAMTQSLNYSKYETLNTKSKSKETSSNYIDATLISCGYWDNALKAHSLDGLRLKCSETGGHLGAINCLRLGEDDTLLITGGADGTCRVWTANNADMGSALIDSYVKTAQEKISDNTLMCCLVLWGHGSPISSLAFDTDLDIVVSGSAHGTICIHTVRRGNFIRSLQVADFFPPANILATKSGDVGVRKLAIHKDGTFVAHLETGLLQMYTINGTKLGCIDAGEKLHAMEMIPGGHSLVTGGESGHVILRSLRNLAITYVLDLSDYGPIHCITFTPPPLHSKSIQQFMFVGTQDGSITVACAQREEGLDDDDEETPTSAQYTQHQAVTTKETKSWWR